MWFDRILYNYFWSVFLDFKIDTLTRPYAHGSMLYVSAIVCYGPILYLFVHHITIYQSNKAPAQT